MDSMRHLSTSLPPTRRRPQENQPQLLADFKAAALSVTNLYKTAAASQDKARAAGYQDALDDLLAFLDTEELGLMDGEGWRVRQWATERLVDDGMHNKPSPAAGSDDEDEASNGGKEEEVVERTSSPEVQRKESTITQSSSDLQETSPAEITRPEQSQGQTRQLQQPPSTNDFTFRSTQPYPTNHDREAGMDIDTTTTPTISTTSSTPTHSPEPTANSNNIRLIPRSSRRTNHNRHRNTPTINFNLGVGAGSKRKMPYSDFFDIEGFGDGQPPADRREGGKGNGKRGRHV